MYRHLVAVEVGVERGANQRVYPYRRTFHQDRLKSLNPQAVQGRRSVE
jgi:hypothetical protein